MPVIRCETCQEQIDLDYDVDHEAECKFHHDDEDFSGASHDNNGNEYPNTDR